MICLTFVDCVSNVSRAFVKPTKRELVNISHLWHGNMQFCQMLPSADGSFFQELIGEPAGKLHTGRSRNDQVCPGIMCYGPDRLGAKTQEAALCVFVSTRL